MVEEVMKSSCNPDLQYFLIKEKYYYLNNQMIKLDDSVDFTFFLKNKKLDVFRSMVQYVEEFLFYFYAKISNCENIEYEMGKIKISNILKLCTHVVEDKFEDYAKYQGYENVEELFKKVFDIDRVSKNIIDIILYICHFYVTYNDIYNSMKHGYSVLDFDFNAAKISLLEEVLSFDDEFIEFYCGNNDVEFYKAIVPLNLLINEVLNILEATRDIFNFMMKTNDYLDSAEFNNRYEDIFSQYGKVYNGDNIVILPNVEEFEDIGSSNIRFCYGKFSLSRSTIRIELSENISKEFPFYMVLWDNTKSINPKYTITDISVANSLYLNVNELINLKKINDLIISGNYQIEILNDEVLVSQSIKLMLGDEINEFDDNILNNLKILGLILQKDLNLSFNLTNEQKSLILDFNNKNKENAEKLYEKLMDEVKTRINVYVDTYKNGNVTKEYLGYSFEDIYRIFVENDVELEIDHTFPIKNKKIRKIIKRVHSDLDDSKRFDFSKLNKADNMVSVQRYTNEELGFKEDFLIFHIPLK